MFHSQRTPKLYCGDSVLYDGDDSLPLEFCYNDFPHLIGNSVVSDDANDMLHWLESRFVEDVSKESLPCEMDIANYLTFDTNATIPLEESELWSSSLRSETLRIVETPSSTFEKEFESIPRSPSLVTRRGVKRGGAIMAPIDADDDVECGLVSSAKRCKLSEAAMESCATPALPHIALAFASCDPIDIKHIQRTPLLGSRANPIEL